ncbi:helix-turn-helix domain-containing protein [Methylobacterium sp. Leaf123]|uniref:helix-turn-helix domain-containing protein n=1 Tax=Methylobacterium sp. Leaf123 TaxID=1736264 RepID=UPI000AEB0DD7|nr:helix-turn-helix domain-containing protein [Methylobacterium sp. Leaf123]
MEARGVTRRGHSVDEAGEIIGCGRTKVFSLIRDGQLKAHKVGTRTIIFDTSINEFFDRIPAVAPRNAAQR